MKPHKFHRRKKYVQTGKVHQRNTESWEKKANSSFSRKSEVQKKRETSLKNRCAKKHTRDFRGKNSRILWVYLKDSTPCQEVSCFSKHLEVQN